MAEPQISSAPVTTSGRNVPNNINPPEIDFSKLPSKKLLKRKNLPGPKERKPWEDVELPVDALLLTVNDCELLSCLSYLNPGFFKSCEENLGDLYFGEIGEGKTMKIALKKCEMGSGGPGGSEIAVKNAVAVLRPKLVICVGFCGCLDETKLKLGDVIVSSKLGTYASVKVTDSGTQHRGFEVPLPRNFLQLITSSADGWNEPLTDTDYEVIVKNGEFLSGPEVVDSKERRAHLTSQYPNALAIEMEAEGLYAAAHDLKMEWAVIKGVSNFADGNKSNTDSWREFASVMAASLTAHILSDPSVFENWPHYKPTVPIACPQDKGNTGSENEIDDEQMAEPQITSAPVTTSGRNIPNNINPPEIDFSKLPSKKLLKRKNLPGPKDWEGVELPVDALLLTVNGCEFLSCVSYLNPGFFRSYEKNLGYVYFGEIGKGKTMKIALIVCEMGSGGPGSSTIAVKNAVAVLGPKLVICVGFCGCLDEKKLKLGDVIVSTKLGTYSSVKVTDGGTQHRGFEVPLERDFLQLIKSAADSWNEPLTDTDYEVTVQNGEFLSGAEVVDNKERRAYLTSQYPNALGIEMEAEGLHAAAHDLKMEWAVIKGVSNFADGNKSNTDSWRQFASVMAASLTAHILSDPSAFKDWPHYKRPEAKKAKKETSETSSAMPLRNANFENIL